MKGVVGLSIGIFLFVFTVEIVQAVENRSIREEELRQAVTSAVYTALEMSITEREYLEAVETDEKKEEKLNQKMKECFMNALKILVKSDSKITVSILKADYKKGILDVYTEAEFFYNSGKKGCITYRKTGILNQY